MSITAPDPGMLDLLLTELTAHGGVLRRGAGTLGPHSTTDALEALERAASAIKSASRIVGIPTLGSLAHAVVKLLGRMKSGAVSIDHGAPLLLEAAAVMSDIGTGPATEATARIERAGDTMDGLRERIDHLEASPAAAPPPASAAPPPAPTASQEAVVDTSMLDLFMVEVDNNVHVLEDGLVMIETRQTPAAVEPLMRAAHSIKGAARIVGLHAAVTLAHAMEDVLSAAQHGTVTLASDHIDALLQGNDVLATLRTGPAGTIPERLVARADDIAAISERLRALTSTDCPAAPASPPAASASPPAPAMPPSQEPTVDTSMLDLFMVEVDNNVHVLEDGLVTIETRQTPAAVEPLMRAAHSIKGAARIVGLHAAVTLAHAMEDVLSAAQHGTVTLTSDHIDALLQGNDVLATLRTGPAGTIPGRLVARADDIAAISERLRALMAGGSPASPPAAVSPRQAPSAPASATPAAAPSEMPKRSETDTRFVRVPSRTLNRVIALAGENLVQAKSMKGYSAALFRIKVLQQELLAAFEAVLTLTTDSGASEAAQSRVRDCLTQLDGIARALAEHREEFELFSHRLEHLTNRLYDEVIISRMRPFSEGLHGFSRLVRDLSRSLAKTARLVVEGEATQVDRDILEKLEAPLNHLVRNALDHGLETPGERRRAGKPEEGTLTLEARHKAGRLNISLSDDGRGINMQILRRKVVEKGYVPMEMAENLSSSELLDFLFLPGFSTAGKISEVSGRGVGLDVVMSMVQEVGGSIHVDSVLGRGTTFTLQLPITLSVIRALLVTIGDELYALPLSRIDRLAHIPREQLQILEDRQYCMIQNERIGIIDAHELLGRPASAREPEKHHVVVISDRLNRYGFVVDSYNGERDLVVIPLDPMLGKVPNISAGAIIEDGSPLLIIDVDDLMRSIDTMLAEGKPQKLGASAAEAVRTKRSILVVDDSLTVREVERKLLQNNGYQVTTAVDGMDGWITLQRGGFDLVISDIDMPRMNGFEFVRKIKSDPKHRDIPVMIVSYKDREEDRARGLDAGANYYFSKSSFHDETLLVAVRDLIGEA